MKRSDGRKGASKDVDALSWRLGCDGRRDNRLRPPRPGSELEVDCGFRQVRDDGDAALRLPNHLPAPSPANSA